MHPLRFVGQRLLQLYYFVRLLIEERRRLDFG